MEATGKNGCSRSGAGGQALHWLREAACGLAIGVVSANAHSQPAYPPDALRNATSTQAAATALGAARPELSGYLLIDAPDVALPGKIRVYAESQLPGTSQIVLLKTSLKAVGAAQSPPEKVLVAAAQIAPGEKAQLQAEFDAATTTNLVLMAQFRGQWFYATRQVKIGSAAD
ncbi:hypothetical protein [Piscinibacter sakaiensis]|uniref:hypothetical protein n=1 Tax=Piscinibacter sakaiensis TaxID=1547922 RepID=UPI003AAD1573